MRKFFILLLSLFLLFPQAANAALVAWWKLDEASWNGTASEVVDSAGANHGTSSGGATTKVGKMKRGQIYLSLSTAQVENFNAEWKGRHYGIKQVMPIVVEEGKSQTVVTVYVFYFGGETHED